MHMFRDFLDSLPKNRSEMVNDLHPESVVLPPHVITEPDYLSSLSTIEDPMLSPLTSRYCSFDEEELRTMSSASNVALSRAMTDSEIDYERYERIKNRRRSEPWSDLRAALDAFPSDYLMSVNRFRDTYYPETIEEIKYETDRRLLRNEQLIQRMNNFFDEDCLVFAPDDPGLSDLQDALDSLDLNLLDDNYVP